MPSLPKPYYEQDGITIYHGDAREIVPLLGAVDVTITDPPYGVMLKGKTAKQRGKLQNTFRAGTYDHDDTPEYVSKVVVPIISQCRDKSTAMALTPGTRNCFLYPPPDHMGTFYSAAGTGVSKWGFVCSQPILYYGRDPYLRTRQGARPDSFSGVYPNDANKYDHPCAKPIRMWKWLVERASLQGELILDPFLGSGTTAQAALETGRRCIGIELSERFCEVAVKRLQQSVLPMFTEAAS